MPKIEYGNKKQVSRHPIFKLIYISVIFAFLSLWYNFIIRVN